jgi:hypothetical protein
VTGPRDQHDGRRDFDFLTGSWRVRNRSLRPRKPGSPPEWVEFESEAESRPILGGLGNIDTYHVRDFPARGEFHGFAFRLYEPATGLWRIWWASTVAPGALDPPLAGRFTDGEGHFEGDDHVDARPIKVRFKWSEITPTSARWQQAFSFDRGRTFEVNWVMEFSRTERRAR